MGFTYFAASVNNERSKFNPCYRPRGYEVTSKASDKTLVNNDATGTFSTCKTELTMLLNSRKGTSLIVQHIIFLISLEIRLSVSCLLSQLLTKFEVYTLKHSEAKVGSLILKSAVLLY